MSLGADRTLPRLGLGLILVIGGTILGGLSRHRKMQRWLRLASYMVGLILTGSHFGGSRFTAVFSSSYADLTYLTV